MNWGAMPAVRPLLVERYDRENWSVITLEGEIDRDTAPLARSVIEMCLRGTQDVDIDLTAVSFCDVSGLNLFLAVSQYATAAGKQLRLSHPTSGVTRLFALAGSSHLLRGPADSARGLLRTSKVGLVTTSALWNAHQPSGDLSCRHAGDSGLGGTAPGDPG